MDLLRLIEMRVGRWLAYADSCMNADEALARCQSFWTLVAVLMGVICVVVLISVIARIVQDHRRGHGVQGDARYKR